MDRFDEVKKNIKNPHWEKAKKTLLSMPTPKQHLKNVISTGRGVVIEPIQTTQKEEDFYEYPCGNPVDFTPPEVSLTNVFGVTPPKRLRPLIDIEADDIRIVSAGDGALDVHLGCHGSFECKTLEDVLEAIKFALIEECPAIKDFGKKVT